MYCPVCRSKVTRVIDSRIAQDGMTIRRRRDCEKCHYRFSTKEETELLDVTVVKKDGGREMYAREKIEHGILRSLAKRSYTKEKFDRMIYAIERDIQKKKKREITSEQLGNIIMRHLAKLDKVAFIRFASIYRAFEDIDKFEKEIRELQKGRSTRKKKKK